MIGIKRIIGINKLYYIPLRTTTNVSFLKEYNKRTITNNDPIKEYYKKIFKTEMNDPKIKEIKEYVKNKNEMFKNNPNLLYLNNPNSGYSKLFAEELNNKINTFNVKYNFFELNEINKIKSDNEKLNKISIMFKYLPLGFRNIYSEIGNNLKMNIVKNNNDMKIAYDIIDKEKLRDLVINDINEMIK